MKITTICNQKGGVGKTTTSVALATGLARKGYRVLAVDLDPQANLEMSSGVSPLLVHGTIYEVFKGVKQPEEIIETVDLGYDVLPGGIDLAGADMDFTQTGREFMLREALTSVQDNYDHIIIDTPPTLGILTVNALAAASSVIIPMAVDIYSLQGLSQLNLLIQNVRKYCNPDLAIDGLLVTKWTARQRISNVMQIQMEQAAASIGTKVFDTHIRESVAIREVALLQADMFRDAKKANATVDYQMFLDELLEGGADNDQ